MCSARAVRIQTPCIIMLLNGLKGNKYSYSYSVLSFWIQCHIRVYYARLQICVYRAHYAQEVSHYSFFLFEKKKKKKVVWIRYLLCYIFICAVSCKSLHRLYSIQSIEWVPLQWWTHRSRFSTNSLPTMRRASDKHCNFLLYFNSIMFLFDQEFLFCIHLSRLKSNKKLCLLKSACRIGFPIVCRIYRIFLLISLNATRIDHHT